MSHVPNQKDAKTDTGTTLRHQTLRELLGLPPGILEFLHGPSWHSLNGNATDADNTPHRTMAGSKGMDCSSGIQRRQILPRILGLPTLQVPGHPTTAVNHNSGPKMEGVEDDDRAGDRLYIQDEEHDDRPWIEDEEDDDRPWIEDKW